MIENQPSIPQTVYIRKLNELSCADGNFAGAKAANLGELVKVGFPVPDGFVLTIDAFNRFLADNNIGTNSPSEEVAAGVIPPDIANALLAAATDLGDVALAVRSSGIAEDLPSASFAGQYETILNVRGKDALLEAVRRCWSSAFNERVLAYRKAQGQQGAPSMAVLVQQMVEPEAAGVAFTTNPVTGERDVTIVNAIRGLGERLVSGQASPDEWLIKGEAVTCQNAPEGAIDADQARVVADIARKIEAHYDSPQDIEWAYVGGILFLLQARPITALPEESIESMSVRVEPPPGFWQRINYDCDYPTMPVYRSIHYEAVNPAWRQTCDEQGMLFETMEIQDIGGWVYLRLVPLGGKEGRIPPAWLLPILARVHPLMRSRIKKCIKSVRSDRAGQIIRLWHEKWKPLQISRIAELREVDLHSLSDSALDQHIAALASFYKESVGYHFSLFVVADKLSALVFACRDLLGWDDTQTMELLSGLSDKSREPALQLAELARLAAERPVVRAFLEKGDYNNADNLVEVDPDFAAAFEAYRHEFGCRTLQYAFHTPTLAERPALILNLIRNQMIQSFDMEATAAALNEKRTAALEKARTTLAGHPAKHRERFERALAGAELAYPVREDNVFYNQFIPFGLARYGLLEVGSRLAERSQIADRDDVFFLGINEARSALRNGVDLQPLVSTRKAERAWEKAHPGPETYGQDPGPPPSFVGFPAEVRFLMNTVLWYRECMLTGSFSGKGQTVEDDKLRGIAASAGNYTGPARVVMGESEFNKIRAGDVLVCPITTPVWSIIFPSVSAVITDTGGTLSHPAIIAREYGVPAVVATGNATSRLHDGQSVTVDGTAGVVELNV